MNWILDNKNKQSIVHSINIENISWVVSIRWKIIFKILF